MSRVMPATIVATVSNVGKTNVCRLDVTTHTIVVSMIASMGDARLGSVVVILHAEPASTAMMQGNA